ncbi:MAG: M3 family oligoendopeptidase [Peptostreptococcaceae bacterium]
MKFKDFKYERPCYESTKEECFQVIDNIIKSSSYKIQRKNIDRLNKIRNNIKSMSTIASIKYSIDTSNSYFEEEKIYWDEHLPLYEEINSVFYKAILESQFKEDIIYDFGDQFLNIASYSIKAFSTDIIKELQEENKLCSKYTKLLASAKINYDGKVLNLSGMGGYMLSEDREIRKEASIEYYNFFKDKEEEFDNIFDDLVKLRDKISRKLNFNSFVELGYIRMMRTDYNSSMVEEFRKQVLEYIVPVASKLYEKQTKRLKVDKLTYIDESLEFLTGNATLKGDENYIIESGKKMYSELSNETKEFFGFMLENELMDLVTKENKGAGGYCTYIPNYKSPFIFSNFNKTSEDIDVLTHEAGHAFQLYMSSHIDMPETNFPTLDSCEIHSMSMEFITWPWMEIFFKEDTDKYKFSHMSSAIKFIPYGIVVDEFQHHTYLNPDLSKKERKSLWRELEKKYLPHKNYDKYEFLENGNWWFKQGHIFKNPFYYIDYTLAQICALQFWNNMRIDKEKTWKNYLDICKVGGTKSFLEIIEIGNLKSPFEKNSIEEVVRNISNWLESIDQENL